MLTAMEKHKLQQVEYQWIPIQASQKPAGHNSTTTIRLVQTHQKVLIQKRKKRNLNEITTPKVSELPNLIPPRGGILF